MQYHTIEQIGPKRSLTSHGFLLCRDVPIARTEMQLYGPGETPIEPGPPMWCASSASPRRYFTR
jgi:hypothetical protein